MPPKPPVSGAIRRGDRDDCHIRHCVPCSNLVNSPHWHLQRAYGTNSPQVSPCVPKRSPGLMPQQVPLRPGDPRRLGRYRLGGRIEGIPSEDPVFIGLSADGREVAISLLRGDWAHDAAARDRFAAEAAVAKRVPPFCAARVLDAGLDGEDAYLV